jgi:lysozyme
VNSLTQDGLDLIKSFESCSLTAYKDVKGVPTQGWGHTGEDVTADSPPITQEQADSLLAQDLTISEMAVTSAIHVPINDNQYSALTSLVFNCGTAPLQGHLGQYLNAGEFEQAADAFLSWNHIDGNVVNGLTNRREAERNLFLTPIEG